MDAIWNFWTDESRWARDTADYVFLARAVHTVGRALFHDDWNSSDPVVRLEKPLPRVPASASYQTLVRVHSLLRQHHPELGRQPFRNLNIGFPIPPTFNDAEWKKAQALFNSLHESTIGPCTRFSKVQAEIARACESGELISVLRPTAGGAMSAPLAGTMWNTERWAARFSLCQMDPSHPFSVGIFGVGSHYIFLSRESLDRHSEKLRNPNETVSTVGAEARCRRWLEEHIDASPHKRTKQKAKFMKEALAKFSISMRAFDRAWDSAIENKNAAAWKKGGAPKGVPHKSTHKP